MTSLEAGLRIETSKPHRTPSTGHRIAFIAIRERESTESACATALAHALALKSAWLDSIE
jgi:hypothetical protein